MTKPDDPPHAPCEARKDRPCEARKDRPCERDRLTAANAAPRCGAKARTRGHAPCRNPAMANGRCRMHGGGSTGARTAQGLAKCRTARLVHGCRSAETVALRKEVMTICRELRRLVALAELCYPARRAGTNRAGGIGPRRAIVHSAHGGPSFETPPAGSQRIGKRTRHMARLRENAAVRVAACRYRSECSSAIAPRGLADLSFEPVPESGSG